MKTAGFLAAKILDGVVTFMSLTFYLTEKIKDGRVLVSHKLDLLTSVVGRNRWCRWKQGSVHVPKCKSFLVTGVERKHVKRHA